MDTFMAWIVLAVLSGVSCAAVIAAILRPASELLRVNSYISPASRFYLRAFWLIMVLATLSVVIAAGEPNAEQSKYFIDCVWWIGEQWKGVLMSMVAVIGGYAVLLSILLAVLGRYRD
jgi:hypothetical protein